MSRWSMATSVATLALFTLPAAGVLGADFKSTWMSPEAKGTTFGDHDTVLALVMNAQAESRNGAEADLTQELKKRGVAAVPAYSVIPPDVIGDQEKARPYIEKTGARYAVVMRVLGKDKEIRGSGPQYAGPSLYTAPYYGSFYGAGYYSFGWAATTFNSGNMAIQNIVQLETLIYDLDGDKLIWAGVSETRNPSTVQKFVKDVVKAASKEMRKQGFVKR